jgi:hypothetical protein
VADAATDIESLIDELIEREGGSGFRPGGRRGSA